ELQATGYLASASYAPLAGGPKAGEKVVYGIHPTFDRRPRRRAGSAAHGSVSNAAPPTPRQRAGVALHGSVTTGQAPELTPLSEERQAAERSPLPLGDGQGEGVLPTPAAGRHAASPVATVEPQKSPLQIELESFGVTPARAAALVATHPEAHVTARIEYVRDLLGRSGARSLKNPAGFLTRAIEDAYTIPDQPSPAHIRELQAVREASPLSIVADAASALSGSAAASPATPPVATAEPSHLAHIHAERPTDVTQPCERPADPVAFNPHWGPLAAALKERLTAATYAAWILPACPVDTASPDDAAERPTLTLQLPTAFALDRWRRPPISTALQAASASLNITVVLRYGTAAAEEA
ncbi:MAG: hypothetical protein ACRDJN_30790, partial [Chloroflexota bacterium]